MPDEPSRLTEIFSKSTHRDSPRRAAQAIRIERERLQMMAQ
jgi:hypothetical protein